MPTVQSFGSWKTGGPAADSSDLTANRRKRAEYLDYLNAQANNISPATPTSYGPVATWKGPVPFGSTSLVLGYAGGGPIRKTFIIRNIVKNIGKDRVGFCNACNDFTKAITR